MSGEVKKEASHDLEAAAAQRIQSVTISHHEGPLLIPATLSLTDAVAAILQRIEALDKVIDLSETIDAFPWDGALAIRHVLKEKFGWIPPTGSSISIETGVGKTEYIPWGAFVVPGIDATFRSGTNYKDGLMITQFSVKVKGKHEDVVRALFAEARAWIKDNSIFRGKAFEIKFLDDDGDMLPLPTIKFLDLSKVDESKLIYSKAVQELIDASLFTPIRRVRELAANGIPVKRGTLLYGKFGTGKTEAARVAGKLAVEQGMTYMYVPRTNELSHAITFAKRYQDPGVLIFAEDIDRPMSGERTYSTDAILNNLDGVGSKGSNTMIVLTTNDVDAIEPALLRPGRLDAVIEVTPPDAEAAGRLVRLYGGKSLAADISLVECGAALEGMIPAVIGEVMQRAKLTQLRLTPVGEPVKGISTDAIVLSGLGMRKQLELINRVQPTPEPASKLLKRLGDFIFSDSDEELLEHEGRT